jgi:glutamyl-tRNA synthetase
MAAFFFTENFQPPTAEELIQKKMDAAATKNALQRSLETLEALPDFRAETQETAMRALCEELGLSAGQLFGTVRVATTSQKVSPPLFESMEILGRDTSLERIRQSIAGLG